MSNRTLTINDPLYEYLLHVSLREPEILWRLRRETGYLEMANMQISPEQGQFMALLVRLLGVHRAIEVGVFTGYSALAVALALPRDGELIACDINRDWTDMAQRYWQEAGVAHKIDLRLAPAGQTLQKLIDGGGAGSFDFAFIDADKVNYPRYYEACLQLIRPGGLIAIDNVLWGGDVIDDDKQDEDTIAIREINEMLHADERVDISLVPIGDGLTLVRRRS